MSGRKTFYKWIPKKQYKPRSEGVPEGGDQGPSAVSLLQNTACTERTGNGKPHR